MASQRSPTARSPVTERGQRHNCFWCPPCCCSGDAFEIWLPDGLNHRRVVVCEESYDLDAGPRSFGPCNFRPDAPVDDGNGNVTGHRRKEPKKALVKDYEPTPEERKAVEAVRARKERRTPAPRVKFTRKGGVAEVGLDHKDPALGGVLLSEAVGTCDPDFLHGLLRQLVNVGSQGPDADEEGTNFALAVVKGVAPQDEIEAMLAAQMAAVHNATMTFAPPRPCGQHPPTR